MSYYTELETAKHCGGLRLVTTRGIPGPWGEAAKSIMHVKKIPVVHVAQDGGQENAELAAWVGVNNAPVAIWENERPRTGWAEILLLAERLAPAPPLIPSNEADRATMFGLAHEICGEDGYGWNRRLMFFEGWRAFMQTEAGTLGRESFARMCAKYDPGTEITRVRQRLIDILAMLSARLEQQKSLGSRYYIANQLSAVDIYSACFAAMVKPLPLAQCPTTPEMHAGYHEQDPDILAAAGPRLLDHRDYIYNTYLELPMRF
ncbi:hypothetical protein GCM10010909_01730 [Acidocella aquatica]|uniref:Glutathione S-transferase n=1 Tax=Acidocella aquatica TaxID=1922313 RepID=A0ABQ6A5W5_9PROT|nr:hypothetical protein [Acidocella aquatica]GLR65495.1 hypothetical protein GCM10010909_01730 [Acidocella aquatica]